MCGIAGYIRRNKGAVPNSEKVMKDLLYFNRLRGVDALGICRVSRWSGNDKVDTVEVFKNIGDPYKLAFSKEFEGAWKWQGDNRYFITHNRLATKGEKTQKCAQPFDEDGVVLAHNGTLHHINGEQEYPGVTDSQSIAKMIGDGVSLTEFEARVFGSFALVWYDKKDGSLNFFRNEDRPLGLVITKDSVYFGSESYLVAGAIIRQNGGLIEKITNIKPYDHWKYHYDEGKWETLEVPHGKKSFSRAEEENLKLWENNLSISDMESCYPKYEAGTGTSSRTTGGQSTLPVLAPFRQPAANDCTPFTPVSYKGKGKDNWRKRIAKAHYHQITEGLGYTVGDTINFSVVGSDQTKRSQIILEGMGVTFSDSPGPEGIHLSPKAYIYAMVSGISLEEIRTRPFIYEGIISEIRMSKNEEGDKTITYRFAVKDAKPTKMFDIFRGVHKETGRLDLAENKTIVFSGPPRKAEEREFADNKLIADAKKWLENTLGENEVRVVDAPPTPQGAKFFTCDGCAGIHNPSAMHRHVRHYDIDDMQVLVKACNSCNNKYAKDHEALERLFEQKRQEILDADLKSVEIIHPTHHTVQ